MANNRKNKSPKSSKSGKTLNRGRSSCRSALIKASFAQVRRHTAFVKKNSKHSVKLTLAEGTINSSPNVKSKVVPIRHNSKGRILSVEVNNPASPTAVVSSPAKHNIKDFSNFSLIITRCDAMLKNEKIESSEVFEKVHDEKFALSKDDKGLVTSVKSRKSNFVSSVQKKNAHSVIDDEEDKPVVSEPSSLKASSSVSPEKLSLTKRNNVKSIKIFKKRPLLVNCEKKIRKNGKRLVPSKVNKINKIFRNKKFISKSLKKEKHVCVIAPFQNDVISQCTVNTHSQIPVDSILPLKKQKLLKVTKLLPHKHPSFSKNSKKILNETSRVSVRHSSLDEHKIVNKISEKVLDSELDKNNKNLPKASNNIEVCSLSRRNSKHTKGSITACDNDFISNEKVDTFQDDDEVKYSIINDYQAVVENNLLPLKQEEIPNLTQPPIHLHNLFSRNIKDNYTRVVKKTSRHSSLDDKELVRKSVKLLDSKLLTNLKKSQLSKRPRKCLSACRSSLRLNNSIATCDNEFISNEKLEPLPLASELSTTPLSKNHSHSVGSDEISVDTSEVSVKTVSAKKQKVKSRKDAERVLTSVKIVPSKKQKVKSRKGTKNVLTSLKTVRTKKTKLKTKKVSTSVKIVRTKKPIKISKKDTQSVLISEKRKKSYDNRLSVKKKSEKTFSTKKSAGKSGIICTQTPVNNYKKPSSTCEKQISKSRRKSVKKQILHLSDPILQNIPLDSLLPLRKSETPSTSTCKKQIPKASEKSSKKLLTDSDLYSDLSIENIPVDSLVPSSRKKSAYEAWLSKCVVDSDYDDDLYDAKDFEKFKTLFEYASDTKFDLILNSKKSHLVADLTLDETAEFIENFYVPVDSLSRILKKHFSEISIQVKFKGIHSTDEVPVEKPCKKIPKKVPFGKMKYKTTEREQFVDSLADEKCSVYEKFNSKEDSLVDFLRIFRAV